MRANLIGAAPVEALRESKSFKRKLKKMKGKKTPGVEKDEDSVGVCFFPFFILTETQFMKRNTSFEDSKSLVTPHLNIYKDSTSSHFPLNIPEDEDDLSFNQSTYSTSDDEYESDRASIVTSPEEYERDPSRGRTGKEKRRKRKARKGSEGQGYMSPRIVPNIWTKMQQILEKQERQRLQRIEQEREEHQQQVLQQQRQAPPRPRAPPQPQQQPPLPSPPQSPSIPQRPQRPPQYYNIDSDSEDSETEERSHSDSESETYCERESLQGPIITPHSTQDEMKQVLDTVVNASTISRGLAQSIGVFIQCF